MIPHPLCFVRWLYRSLRCGAWVEGHDYREIEEKTPANVQVLKCIVCGDVSVCWDWSPIEKHAGDKFVQHSIEGGKEKTK